MQINNQRAHFIRVSSRPLTYSHITLSLSGQMGDTGSKMSLSFLWVYRARLYLLSHFFSGSLSSVALVCLGSLSSTLKVSCSCAGQLPGCADPLERNRCYASSHLANSQKRNNSRPGTRTSTSHLCKRWQTCGPCVRLSLCTSAWKTPHFFFIFQTFQSELCSWANGSFKSMQSEKWLSSSTPRPVLAKVVAIG